MVGTGLARLTMNYLIIIEDFELTVEAIDDATDCVDRVGTATQRTISLLWRIFNLLWRPLLTSQMVGIGLAPLTMNYLFTMEDFELTVEAIVDATDGWDRVGPTHDELSLYYGGL